MKFNPRFTLLVAGTFLLASFSTGTKRGFIPPGTVRITETYFVDKTEVSNFSWLEYQYWVSRKYGKNSEEYLGCLPDTSVWGNNDSLVRYYLRAKNFRDHPVVGISWEQAVDFCKWRTAIVKEFYALRYKKELDIEYRLPTKEEWENFAMLGLNTGVKNGKDKNGVTVVNCCREMTDQRFAAPTSVVDSHEKNWLKIYNCIGNVAEMVAEKGICKGGSWKHTISESLPGKNITYEKTQSWLGFRCVCIYKPKGQ